MKPPGTDLFGKGFLGPFDQFGVRLEGDHVEPLLEIELGVLAVMHADVEDQVWPERRGVTVCHICLFPDRTTPRNRVKSFLRRTLDRAVLCRQKPLTILAFVGLPINDPALT